MNSDHNNYSLVQEFAVRLPGIRPQVNRTLARTAEALYATPHTSFSVSCGENRLAAARVLSDERLNCQTMLLGHRQATEQRLAEGESPTCLVLADTVFYTYSGHVKTKGLKPLQGNVLGIAQQNVMLLNPHTSIPYGVPVIHNWTRGGHQDIWDKESEKWRLSMDYANELAQQMPDKSFVVIHDRESDIHSLLKAPRQSNAELIVRVYQPRKYELVNEELRAEGARRINYLEQAATQAPVVGYKTVSIYRSNRRLTIKLELRASSVRIFPDKELSERLHSAEGLNLVVAREVAAWDDRGKDCFDEAKAAEWLLVTSLSVDTLEEISTVVEYYGLRWRIERLHYVTKSGALNSEQAQFGDVVTKCNALIINTIVAWKILCLTYRARQDEMPAEHCLDAEQIAILKLVTSLGTLTLRQACHAVAGLVGFKASKARTDPGVKKVAEGLQKLHYMQQIYRLMQPSDKTVST